LHNEEATSLIPTDENNATGHTNLSQVNHIRELAADISRLFDSSEHSDIQLIVEGVEFNAHKIILAARSDYFRALLYSGMKESAYDRIVINENKAGTFKLLLQYIYTGKIYLRSEREDTLIDLLGLAHKYGFIDLQNAISEYLESILDIKNVCAVYDISCLYQLRALEETCVRFIDRNCMILIKNNSLMQLSCDSLASIISRDSFCAPELDIFNIVKRWHELNGSLDKPKRELIEKIRLPLMKLDELLNAVRESNLIESNLILDAIKLKHESTDMSLNYRGCLYPNENIAANRYQAIVIKGEFKSALLDGDIVNYDFDRGFTYHPIDDANQNAIIVKLGNASIFNQIKLLLWDKDIRYVLVPKNPYRFNTDYN
jgi:BTB/POZ domain-containing protein 9